jgi:23S rRNA (guanosine2251-2'-O)-methyltransferase
MPTKESEKFADSSLMEGMTSIRAVIAGAEAGVNDRKIEKILFDKAKAKSKFRELGFLRAKGEEKGFSVELTTAEEIDSLAIGQSHGGVLAYTGDRTIKNITECEIKEGGFYVFLQGIEDPYNFGYALRSLYAAGCDGILLGERNWLTAAGVVARASAGASESMPVWAGDTENAVSLLKDKGYRIVCAGIRDSVSLYEADLKKPLLLVVGGEKRGISAEMLSKADEIVRIDYGREFRGSLSAASAATVLGFEVLRQNR